MLHFSLILFFQWTTFNLRIEGILIIHNCDLSQASNSEMEGTLYKVVSESTVSDELWEDVSKMFDELTRQSKPTRISFCNSLLDILWSWRLGERASRILQLAQEKEVYDDSFHIFTKWEWCLDLHR